MRVGSYSYVHQVRKHGILYTIKYLERKTGTTALVEDLKTWISSQSDQFVSPISYDYVRFIPQLHDQGLDGLYYFVNCSDCDGHWSADECKHIAEWINKITTDADADVDDEELNHIRRIGEVFNSATEYGGYVKRE